MEEKRCVHCGRILPVSEFYANCKTADGLQSWCKECFSTRKKSLAKGFVPSPPSKEEIEELYLNQHYTMKMVADALSMNKSTLMYWMQRYGIQRRSISEARRTAISLGQIKSRKGEKRSPHSQETKEHMRTAALKRWSSVRAGVSKKKNGYLVVTCGENKHKPVHVVIMEEHIGRKLLPNECVHHINHDRSDNRIENLRLMTRSEHSKLHSLERKHLK